MKDNDKEELLVKKLAQAYAFISDLREEGIRKIDTFLIRKTIGINEQIEKLSEEFPTVFSKYYKEAKQRVTEGPTRGNEKTEDDKGLLEKGTKTKTKRKTTAGKKRVKAPQDKVQKE